MSQKLQQLSQIIDLDDLPEIFSFLTTPVDTLLQNLRVVKFNNQSYYSLNQSAYGVVVRSEQKIAFELFDTGLVLILNPGLDPLSGETFTDLPLSLHVDWEGIGKLNSFQLNTFSAGIWDSFLKILEYFDLSQAGVVQRILSLNSWDGNTLILAINNEYSENLTADLNTFDDPTMQAESIVDKINDQPSMLANGLDPYKVAYDIYIGSEAPGNRLKKLNELVAVELNGRDTIQFLFDFLIPKFYASVRLSAGLEIPRKFLLPVNAAGEVETNEAIKTTLLFEAGELYFSSQGGFNFQKSLLLTFPPTHPQAEIGKTGLRIGFTNAHLNLSDSTNIPGALAAGYTSEFKGAFVEYASITLPQEWFNSIDQGTLRIAGYNLLIGNTGFSGRLALEYINGTPSPGDDYLDLKIGNWEVGFNHFAMTFKQNVITDSFIGGRLKIPKLKNSLGEVARVYLNGHLNEAGDFNFTASEPAGIPFNIFDFVTINFLTLELGRQNDVFYLGTSAQIWFENPIMEKLLKGQKIMVPKLRIYENGNFEIAGDSTLHGRLQGFLRGLIHEDTVNKRGERLVPASALSELRHFSCVKGGAVMDNYLSDVKISEVPEGVKFEFPALDEDLFYRPISGVRLWAMCKHIDMKNHDRSNYYSETERLSLPQNEINELTVALPDLPEGMARVHIYGLQVYVEGLPSKDRRMNGCRWRG